MQDLKILCNLEKVKSTYFEARMIDSTADWMHVLHGADIGSVAELNIVCEPCH